MKTTIEVGGLYQRPESERRSIAKKKMLYDEFDNGLPGIYLEKDDLIVILEVLYHTAKGNKLRGSGNFRAKILTSRGGIFYLYSNFKNWEEVP
jgi:hypothetical protein